MSELSDLVTATAFRDAGWGNMGVPCRECSYSCADEFRFCPMCGLELHATVPEAAAATPAAAPIAGHENDGDWKEIQVKQGATCVACGEAVPGGSAALKEVTFKAVKHVTCPRQVYFASGAQTRRGVKEWVFHRAGCNWVGHLRWQDRISFATQEEAKEFGCRPCSFCHP